MPGCGLQRIDILVAPHRILGDVESCIGVDDLDGGILRVSALVGGDKAIRPWRRDLKAGGNTVVTPQIAVETRSSLQCYGAIGANDRIGRETETGSGGENHIGCLSFGAGRTIALYLGVDRGGAGLLGHELNAVATDEARLEEGRIIIPGGRGTTVARSIEVTD